MRELGRAIGASKKRLEDTSEDWREEILDYESEMVEGMAGLGFLACRLDITSVVSQCLKMHERAPVLGPKPRKRELMEKCLEPVTGLGLSKITVMDALANFFKHVDEWPADWSNLDARSAATAGDVLALGVARGNTGNMRTGFEKIVGHADYERPAELGFVVRGWAGNLKVEYEDRMRASGLLTGE